MPSKTTFCSLLFLKPSELALSLKILIPTVFILSLFVYFSFFKVLPLVESSQIAELRRQLVWLLVGVGMLALVFGGYLYWQALVVGAGRRRAEETNRVLTRIANAVNTTIDIDTLYRSIHRSLGEIIDATNFFIALYDRQHNVIHFPYYQDSVDTEPPTIENIEHSGSLTGKVILSRQPVLANRGQILAWAVRQGASSVGTIAAQWLGVPLLIKNEVIGVMATQSYTAADQYDRTDMTTLVSVSDQVAVAIERMRNETALRQSVRQYQMLAENHRDVVVALSPSGLVTYCSPAIREFGGYEPGQEIGRHISAYFADAEKTADGVRRFARMVKNCQMGVFEMQFKARGKVPFPVEISLKPMLEADQVVSVMCVMRDISERKAAELQLKNARDALEMRVRERTDDLLKINLRLESEIRKHRRTESILRESEEKYRTLVENIPDVIFSTNDQGNIVTVNNPSENFFGYRIDELLGHKLSFFLHPEDRQMMTDLFFHAITHRVELTKGFRGRLISKDGATCWVELNMRRQFDADDRFLRTDGVLRDITQTKMLQERLIRSERLAATGQLAASVAHEINSPLQGVTSLLNVIRREYSADENLAAHLALIKGAFNSIRNTVKNLMDLNRPGKARNQRIRLSAVLDQTGALVKGYLRDNGVQLQMTVPSDLPVIMGSPQQLGQVFMNLINNAVDAMGANAAQDERCIRIVATLENDQITVCVADTGSGIAEEDMPHIFDAFFTRKKKMGMGVGLSICHRIIEEHNGSITVRTSSPQGAEFVIRLPVSQSENQY